ncbi:MAG TPA: glycosyltransferase family 4 protein [Planctomycetaceae bacterium]|nr:glycosyltransferase family 4 protein [Planctomycetaceae bacterium]
MNNRNEPTSLALVSHLPLKPSGGGLFSVTWNVMEILQEHFRVQAIPPVIPRTSRWEAAISKICRRVLRCPGMFYEFSDQTLRSTALQLEEVAASGVDALFFRSCTRWIYSKPQVPYFVHTDVVFHTFFQNTFRVEDFIRSDLQRIWDAERDFLENAACAFFESGWGLRKAREAYGLQGDHYVVLNNGGVLEPPVEDVWDGNSLQLLTIAKNFRQKGGDLVLEAFKRLKPQYPQLEWSIVGGEPEGDWQSVPGIRYEGFLRPDVPDELQRFRELMANAFLLVHPTREDTNPLVLIEAAYFGCPSVSVNDFAIPELVVDGQTGLLLSRPVTVEALVDAITALIESRERYLIMRRMARERSIRQFNWEVIGQKMAGEIEVRLERAAT